jgi:hypothetical protein
MKKQYIQPEITVLELKLRSQLLQASVPVTEEETTDQW